MIGTSLWDNKVKTSVVVPNATDEKNQVLSLSAWEFILEIGVQVLELQSAGVEASEYASEGRSYKSRNFLFDKTDGGVSAWLFPDQSHVLRRTSDSPLPMTVPRPSTLSPVWLAKGVRLSFLYIWPGQTIHRQ